MLELGSTPSPKILKFIPGGKHSPPTRTLTVVPRLPPAGKICVLVGSRPTGTGCPQAEVGESTRSASSSNWIEGAYSLAIPLKDPSNLNRLVEFAS